MDNLPYNKSDAYSIFEYSKNIIGHSLAEVAISDISEFSGKGRLGQMVEKYFFQYEPNGDENADFYEAGLELKCTPLKRLGDGRLSNKERLVCTLINYNEDWKHSFKESHIYKKCALMLILFYLHQNGIPVQHLSFLYSVLWKIPEKDLLIIEQDYNYIINKIKIGKADELSEGDTTYLGACRKGSGGENERERLYKTEDGHYALAPQRAFSLKTSYMRTILDLVLKSGESSVSNLSTIGNESLVSAEELKRNSFESILINRFKPFFGMSYSQLCACLGVEESTSKAKYADIVNKILTEQGERGTNYKNSEEFIKSGICVKTIRLRKNGMPKEHMSFPAIDYCSIIQEDWFNSTLYDYFTQRFMFVVFNNVGEKGDDKYALYKVFFWTMPKKDLDDAYYYWKNIKDNVLADNYNPNAFYTIRQHKKFHVRPHAADMWDTALAPSGRQVSKYGYWLNADYIKSVIDEQ